MPDFEDLRLADLLEKFRKEILAIAQNRNLSALKGAGAALQSVYDFHVTASKSYAAQEELFKNLYSSFNYAAVIVNNAVKNGGLRGDDAELLNDCLEIMAKCCDKIISAVRG